MPRALHMYQLLRPCFTQMEKVMKKFICSLIVTLFMLSTHIVHAENSPHLVSANISLLSDYLYRGISQTNEGFAL